MAVIVLQAVMVDSSDVTVWYKIGTIALKLDKYQLARHAFEMVTIITQYIQRFSLDVLIKKTIT